MAPSLARIAVHPVKSLDRHPVEEARIAERGALEGRIGGAFVGDREYAMTAKPADAPHDAETASVGGNGDYVNGKRTAKVHRLRAEVDGSDRTVTLRERGGGDTAENADGRTFALDDPDDLNDYLTDFFGEPVSVRREPVGGYPDDREFSGPTLVSTATLDAVASWFDLPVDDVRRRFRANLEVDGVPAFWEDRLYADHGEAVRFRIGDVAVDGVHPCARCVVPSRDPDTGEETLGFRERFIERRRATRPDWLDSDRYDHDFRLMVNTDVPESEWGETIAVGDPVEVVGTHPF